MKKIEKYDFFTIFICIILYAFSIFVGSPLINNTNVINIIVLITFVLYLIRKIIKERKYKFIKRKLDIFIGILVFSSYIALIFRNYTNFDATIEYIIKYTTLLCLYFLIRDIIEKNSKYKKYIINTIIISSISLFIIGLDNLTFNNLETFLVKTNNVIVYNWDNRFVGIFGYANTMAMLMLVISILAIAQYIESEKEIFKIYYNIILFICITTIILSYSRGVWLITVLAYFLYIFLARKKYLIYLEVLFRTGFISIIYSAIAIKLINKEESLVVWLLFIVFGIITELSYLAIKNKIEKIKLKHFIILLSIIFILFIILWNIGLKMTEPLTIFNDVYNGKDVIQNINDVKPNTLYRYEFDIEAKTAYTKEDLYTIEVIEINQYDDEIRQHEITIGNYKGIREIQFETDKNTYRIVVKFKTANKVLQRGLTINSLKINGQDVILKYKYLPKSIVEKVQDINLNTISVSQRFNYMKDSIKLISKYGILGIGADGWKDRIDEVQEYEYYANESHSYILEIFCEFGIIGFIGLLGIIVEIIRNLIRLIKNKEQNIIEVSILLSIVMLVIHSCIDFDLSFMYMLVIFFIFLAMMSI